MILNYTDYDERILTVSDILTVYYFAFLRLSLDCNSV